MGTTVSTELVDAREKRGRDGRRFVAAERRRELLAAFRASVAQLLEVRLPDGTTLRGERAGELAALARALRG